MLVGTVAGSGRTPVGTCTAGKSTLYQCSRLGPDEAVHAKEVAAAPSCEMMQSPAMHQATYDEAVRAEDAADAMLAPELLLLLLLWILLMLLLPRLPMRCW